ncbi:MAG: SUMF1/EgtB/PvdO family nonheme iron enzyme [Alkalinema sp. RU_4_3]|nr:SUMF1/EgtB/PvdO family nonheme iron enzyme [Alkalinema sp. RU_4_3]
MGQAKELLRGGSWNNNPRNCRSAYRNHNSPDNRNNNLGFRVVCVFPAAASTLHPSELVDGNRSGVHRRVQLVPVIGRPIRKAKGLVSLVGL